MTTQPGPYTAARQRYGETKPCPPCGRSHPLEEFTVKDSAKGLLQSKCKAAVRAYGKTWYAANSDTHIQAGTARKDAARQEIAAKLAEFLNSQTCAGCGTGEDLTAVLEQDDVAGRSPRALVRDGWSWPRLEPVLQQAGAAELIFCAFCVRRRPRTAQ